LILVYPYFIGCGVHYYSDVPGLLFALSCMGPYGDSGRSGRSCGRTGEKGVLPESAVLFLGMGLAAVLHYELFVRCRQREAAPLRWMLPAFWTMNLFSHLACEKYLLPVLPVAYLLCLYRSETCGLVERPARVLCRTRAGRVRADAPRPNLKYGRVVDASGE